MEAPESQIAQWRGFVSQGTALDHRDVEELETHLREQIADLTAAGLSPDEAFLVAVKRIGSLDSLSREFAREHGGRLWKQLVVSGGGEEGTSGGGWTGALVFAAGAAITVEAARLAGGFPDEEPAWLFRNLGLLVVPFLAGWFAYRRRLPLRRLALTALPFVVAAAVVNAYPYRDGGTTEALVAIHLPVVLWFAGAYPYMGGTVRSHERRMDFVRFTGEWLIYYVLIALGGGVLVGLTAGILEPTSPGLGERVAEWVLPAGAAGAVVVAAWLVESKQQVVENMAPVLTMIFTPLFGVMLLVTAVVYAATGLGGAFDRDLLGIFDLLMVVVVGLVLYAVSARDGARPPGWMDRIQLVAVAAALLLDVIVLAAMLARVGELGFTPNRTAALGLNLVLLADLAGTAWHSARFLTRRATFHNLERWQTAYLPVFALWAATVVVLLPPWSDFA